MYVSTIRAPPRFADLVFWASTTGRAPRSVVAARPLQNVACCGTLNLSVRPRPPRTLHWWSRHLICLFALDGPKLHSGPPLGFTGWVTKRPGNKKDIERPAKAPCGPAPTEKKSSPIAPKKGTQQHDLTAAVQDAGPSPTPDARSRLSPEGPGLREGVDAACWPAILGDWQDDTCATTIKATVGLSSAWRGERGGPPKA